MNSITMTPEQVQAAIAGYDLKTFKGWTAAALALLQDKPERTAIKDQGGYMVLIDGDLCCLAGFSDDRTTYEMDEGCLVDGGEPDASAWDDERGCWDGVESPEQNARTLIAPVFVTLTFVESSEYRKSSALEIPCDVRDGAMLKIKMDLMDSDEEGQDRITTAGSIGMLTGGYDADHWNVVFANGATQVFDREELSRTNECEFVAGTSPEAIAARKAIERMQAEDSGQSALILTKTQAEAVYSAMCALNNVNALISAFIRTDSGKFIEIHDEGNGIALWSKEVDLPGKETYADQSAFAAYGLQEADKDSADFASWSCS